MDLTNQACAVSVGKPEAESGVNMSVWDDFKEELDETAAAAAEAKRRADAEAAEKQRQAEAAAEEARRRADAAAAEARRQAEAAAAEAKRRADAAAAEAQRHANATIVEARRRADAAWNLIAIRNQISRAYPGILGRPTPADEQWLMDRPVIAMSVLWQDRLGIPIPYPLWTPTMKADLTNAFDIATTGGSVLQSEPVSNKLNLGDDDVPGQVLRHADAWRMYLAYVAQSLVVEINQMVPWSIESASPNGLAHLFNSKEMFHWRFEDDGYRIRIDHGDALPTAPNELSGFMFNGMVLNDQRTTISNLLDWSRANLRHVIGKMTASNWDDHWQYRGSPPVNRIINGTVLRTKPEDGVQHWTAGCWGTTGFLTVMLRTVNIPVRLLSHCGHALPNFIDQSLYLSHGDDPFSFTIATPPMPISEILIDETQYNDWFGFRVKKEAQCKNIGRRPTELALTFLPDRLLKTYCKDKEVGKSHENGEVLELFNNTHTLQQLEDANLWARMDEKLDSLGGCSFFDNR